MGDKTSKASAAIINYEPFGEFASPMSEAFEFVAKTKGGQLMYRGRKGTQFQDLNFITDPTSKMSNILLEKDGQLVPTELTNLNPSEMFNIRNSLINQSAKKAIAKSNQQLDVPAASLGMMNGLAIK